MTTEELGKHLARKLFELGDVGPDNPCTRIEFKCGEWPSNEVAAGGLIEQPLADFLTSVLDDIGRE